MGELILRRGKEKLPLNGHPWIFSGAIERVEGAPNPGASVCVRAANDAFIGYALFDGLENGIAARLFSFNERAKICEALFEKRLQDALALRRQFVSARDTAYRLCFSEADGLPGLIIDIFGTTAVLQSATAGIDRYKNFIAQTIMKLCPQLTGVLEKSDSDGRKQQQREKVHALLCGEMPPVMTEIMENKLRFAVSFDGQKTGFYADQRLNRAIVSEYIAPSMQLLDCFSYTGGFAVHALASGAEHATLVDSSQSALNLAQKNMTLNGIHENRFSIHCGSAFDVLRQLAREKKMYDCIILDPPKLVRSVKQKESGLGAYKDLNLSALHLLKPGGLLASFSCSGNVSPEEFQRMIVFAAKDAHRAVQIVRVLHQSPDHPVLLSCPESAYLKGLLLRVL